MRNNRRMKHLKNKRKMQIADETANRLEKLRRKAFMEGYNYAIRLLEEGKGNRR